MDNSAQAARRWGVEPGYHDISGHWHAVPEPTLHRIVDALSKGRSEPAVLADPRHQQRAFQGDGSRVWGLAVQLYAVRSSRNWGIGDFGDLRTIVKIAADSGASVVGLNPLHALLLDRPDMASPYAPNSRLFLNPLYIAVDLVDGFSQDDPALADAIAAVRDSSLVDYRRVAQLKIAALGAAYDRFRSQRSEEQAADFERFRDERGDSLKRFACFEVLRARFRGTSWRDWPQPWSNPDQGAIDELRRTESRECKFFEFLQWVADRQLARCRREAEQRGLSIGLYLDLAVGVDPAGADAWANQKAVLAGLSIGAPPDDFNPSGQNWGLAPFNPHSLPDNDFAAMRQLLAAAMRHAGAVRLDHVLGLMRLFLVPDGASAAQGAYIRFPFEQLLRVVAEESIKHRCIFIGEDLGTVPEGFREISARWGVWTYRVMMFERRQNGEFKPPSEYPAEALATFNTHDLPSFRGWMSGKDLITKRAIGVDPGETGDARSRSQIELRRMLGPVAGDNGPDHFAAAAGFLAATPSRIVTVAIDDLLDVVEQVNVPGTIDQHPNWRRKLPVTLENWTEQPIFRAAVAAFDHAGRGRRP